VSENIMQRIADEGEIDIMIGDISGSKWHEVDDVNDYNKAVKFISDNYGQYI